MLLSELELGLDLRLVRLDGRNSNSAISDLRRFLVELDDSYPGIDRWLDRRVITDLSGGSRCAYLVYEKDIPIASAIARIGRQVKLCNLRVRGDRQHLGLGTLLVGILALRAPDAHSVYFTAPQTVWSGTQSFFNDFGFRTTGPAGKQYRLWDQEWACSAPMPTVLQAARRRLPLVLASHRLTTTRPCDLVLSVHPRYAAEILGGTKSVEIRRKFSSVWQGSRVMIYATAPSSQFVGDCVIGEVSQASPKTIWRRHREAVGCTRSELMKYCEGHEAVSVLRLRDVRAYERPVEKKSIENMLGKLLRPPQSYLRLGANSNWHTAASLGSLLAT